MRIIIQFLPGPIVCQEKLSLVSDKDILQNILKSL